MEHVIIVAFGVTAESRKEAEEFLHGALPRPNETVPLPAQRIEDWWVAEDERYDRSDNDSAVFCIPGKQQEARDLLRAHGLAW